jgi:hypothetical protein
MYLAIIATEFCLLVDLCFLPSPWDFILTREVFSALLVLHGKFQLSHSLVQRLSLQKRLNQNTVIAIKQDNHITTDTRI